jgi:ABC-type nickel/cobalt efflux system permease component RcnA
MAKLLISLFILLQLICGFVAADAQNPFLSPGTPEKKRQKPEPQRPFLTQIALWQQDLKEKLSALIGQAKKSGSMSPLMAVLLIAFGYGVIHAAGPGHGKAVAMSYILSRNATIITGVLFGTLIALVHGSSGAICVLGLHYILQKRIMGALGTVSHMTQIVSFSLIALLGLGIVVRNGYLLWKKPGSNQNVVEKNSEKPRKSLFPWAVTVGVIPCPAVVMAVVFCLSMDMLALGLFVAAFISLGMAATISFFVMTVVIGKRISLNSFSGDRTRSLEIVLGLVSGSAVAVLGLLFLAASLRSI